MSNEFYGRPQQLIARGLARSMGEGWETARRRDEGNDWVEVRLACEGVVTLAELDTSWFLGNAPGTASLTGTGPDGDVVLLPRTRLQPDTRHRFVLPDAPAVDRVRLDVFPDGGMARLRLWGRPTAAGREALGRRWFDALPDVQALEVLGTIGIPPQTAGRLVGARPLGAELPEELRAAGRGAEMTPAHADLLVTDAELVATVDDARREIPGGWVAVTDGVVSGARRSGRSAAGRRPHDRRERLPGHAGPGQHPPPPVPEPDPRVRARADRRAVRLAASRSTRCGRGWTRRPPTSAPTSG